MKFAILFASVITAFEIRSYPPSPEPHPVYYHQALSGAVSNASDGTEYDWMVGTFNLPEFKAPTGWNGIGSGLGAYIGNMIWKDTNNYSVAALFYKDVLLADGTYDRTLTPICWLPGVNCPDNMDFHATAGDLIRITSGLINSTTANVTFENLTTKKSSIQILTSDSMADLPGGSAIWAIAEWPSYTDDDTGNIAFNGTLKHNPIKFENCVAKAGNKITDNLDDAYIVELELANGEVQNHVQIQGDSLLVTHV